MTIAVPNRGKKPAMISSGLTDKTDAYRDNWERIFGKKETCPWCGEQSVISDALHGQKCTKCDWTESK